MIFAALVAAAAVATAAPGVAAPPDGTYNFAVTSSGSNAGSSSVTVKRTPTGISLHETGSFRAQSFVVDETLDPVTLVPRNYVGTYTRGTQTLTADVDFDHSGATVTFQGVGNSKLDNPPGIQNCFAIESTIVTGFLMLPAQVHSTKLTQFSQIVPSLVLQWNARVYDNATSPKPTNVPSSDQSLSVSNGNIDFDEWYDPSTFMPHAVSLPSLNVTIVLTK